MLSIDVVNGGNQNDIVRNVQNSDGITGGKQNDIILKFPKSDAVKVDESKTTYFSNFTNQMLSIDVVNRRKPNDIIRKFQK